MSNAKGNRPLIKRGRTSLADLPKLMRTTYATVVQQHGPMPYSRGQWMRRTRQLLRTGDYYVLLAMLHAHHDLRGKAS